jgi:hypothetical protein
MPSLVKVFDPEVTRRQLTFVVSEESTPGLMEFFASLPYRTEAALIRTVMYEWFVTQKEAGTLDDAVTNILGMELQQPVRSTRRTSPRAQRKTAQKISSRTGASAVTERPARENQSALQQAENHLSVHGHARAPQNPTGYEMSSTPSAPFSGTTASVSSPSAPVGVAEDSDDVMERLNFLDTLP